MVRKVRVHDDDKLAPGKLESVNISRPQPKFSRTRFQDLLIDVC